MDRFHVNQPVYIKKPNLTPNRIRATVVEVLPSNLYRIILREECSLTDLHSRVVTKRLTGEHMYATHGSLQSVVGYIVLRTDQSKSDSDLEEQLRDFAQNKGWVFEIATQGPPWPLPYINTALGSFVTRDAIEHFLNFPPK